MCTRMGTGHTKVYTFVFIYRTLSGVLGSQKFAYLIDRLRVVPNVNNSLVHKRVHEGEQRVSRQTIQPGLVRRGLAPAPNL
jgi:hypothetical protein